MSLSGLSGEISSAFPKFESADFFVSLRRKDCGCAERMMMTAFGKAIQPFPKAVIVLS